MRSRAGAMRLMVWEDLIARDVDSFVLAEGLGRCGPAVSPPQTIHRLKHPEGAWSGSHIPDAGVPWTSPPRALPRRCRFGSKSQHRTAAISAGPGAVATNRPSRAKTGLGRPPPHWVEPLQGVLPGPVYHRAVEVWAGPDRKGDSMGRG